MAWIKNVNKWSYTDEEDLRGSVRAWNQPDKQSMRLRWTRDTTPQIEWYSDLGHGVDIYKAVDRYIEKHIGEPFDKVYSDFLFKSKFARYRDSNIGFYGYDSARKIFISSFDTAYPSYYIDDDGLIQPIPSKSHPKNRDLKLYLPIDQRYEEYSIDYQKVIQAAPILREYFSEYHINNLIELAGIWTIHPISIESILGWPEAHIEQEIVKRIGSLRSNKHKYIYNLNNWFIDIRLHYIDRIIKAGTREWHIEKCKQKRIQKYGRKHKHDIDTELYDALLITRKHGIYDCNTRERIISHANFYKRKQRALRKKPTYFYKESIGCIGELLY